MLIDSHCHLSRFVDNLPATLERAEAAGVMEMITIGTTPEDWSLYAQMAAEHPRQIHYTVGLHPSDVDQHWESQLDQIDAYMQRECQPVALGEVGLDYFRLPQDGDEAARIVAWQQAAFSRQLEWAKPYNLPVVVHSRAAFHETVEQIDRSGYDWSRVVFHCFAEGAEAMRLLNERGGRGSFTGIVTYKKSDAVREAALAQGLERLMVETDSPYLTPEPHRGKPNEPAYIRYTAAYLAQFFQIDFKELAATATAHTRQFFGL